MNHVNRVTVQVIPTEIYSRVSGYFRPVKQWNGGKREEFGERKFAHITEVNQWEKAKKI